MFEQEVAAASSRMRCIGRSTANLRAIAPEAVARYDRDATPKVAPLDGLAAQARLAHPADGGAITRSR